MPRKKNSTLTTLTGRPTQAQSAHIEKRLREAAVDVFVRSGFEGAKMEAVARAAGITKRTLYARYADKNALFADVVVWATTSYHMPDLPQEIAEWDLATGLLEIARSTLRRALDPDVVRFNKLAIMESGRIKDFSSRAYSTIWSPRVKAVSNLLAIHAKTGAIVVENLEIAAELFMAMVAQRPNWMALLAATRPLELEEEHLQHAVALFMRGIQAPATKNPRGKRKANARIPPMNGRRSNGAAISKTKSRARSA